MKIKIKNPCPENWEEMQDAPEGKFCEKCSKCVVDLTEKTNNQIQEMIRQAEGKEICGRISTRSLSAVAAGIIMVTHLTFVQAQIKRDLRTGTEHPSTDITKLSGRLISGETQQPISNADTFFITKNKFLKSTTNQNGYFSIEIPNDLMEEENVLYFNFDHLNEVNRNQQHRKDSINGSSYGDQTLIFSRNERIENRKFKIDYRGFEIGEVVIVNDPPPDYYYFDGKNISEEKFKELRKNNPQYQYFMFEEKAADVISQDGFIDKLYLLYSD